MIRQVEKHWQELLADWIYPTTPGSQVRRR